MIESRDSGYKEQERPETGRFIKNNHKVHRELGGFWKRLAEFVGLGMVLFYFASVLLGPFELQIHRGIFVLLTYILIFLFYPLKGEARSSSRPTTVDIVFVMASLVCCLYWIAQFDSLSGRLGNESEMDYLISMLGIIVSLEVARRILGWSITIIAVLMLFYAYFGSYAPEIINHGGFSTGEITVELFFSTNGVFGIMANVLATYVILFIFFGVFLNRSGVSSFFLDLSMILAARSAGGSAKVAVIASALFGSISGSAIANTISTGPLAIPLMKKAGFRPYVAGAITPAASIGGMFLPPVMGAGGFIMAEILDVPYTYIMGVAIFPALIYYFSVFMMIHFEAKKYALHGMKETEIPKTADILKKGWFKCLPLIIVTVLLVKGESPGLAAFWSTLS